MIKIISRRKKTTDKVNKGVIRRDITDNENESKWDTFNEVIL